MSTIDIALGSNLDPEENLRQALHLLSRKVKVLRLSTFYRSKPLNRPEQDDFVNGVAEAQTDLPPFELKPLLREIEARLWRVRTADKYAARTIDLDLVSADDPDLRTRAFLTVPVAELAPDLPILDGKMTPGQLAAGLDRSELVPLADYTRKLRKEVLDEPAEG